MKDLKITILDIVVAFSEAFDLIDDQVNSHHYDVAYLSYEIGRRCNISRENISHLVLAALLHDIGCFKLSERLELLKFELHKPKVHAYNGYYLLKDFKAFSKIATLVKYHHHDWNEFETKDDTALLSNILFIADRIAILFDKDKHYEKQLDKIEISLKKNAGTKFSPELVKVFSELKDHKLTWLNFQFEDKETLLKNLLKNCSTRLHFHEIIELGEIFAQIIDFRNRFTALHSTGVASIAEKLAQLTNLDKNEQDKIKLAGYFHDIGKLAIPNKIINKNAPLTNEEFERIKLHPYHTYRIISKINAFKEIATFASQHHEKIDGSGYPFGIKGDELAFNSRVIAVADVFTALTEDRAYRNMLDKTDIINILNNMANKKHLDSSLVKIAIDNFEILQEINLKNQKKNQEKFHELDNYLSTVTL